VVVAAVTFGISTVKGEPLFVGVRLRMNGGVMFGVGLGTATYSVWWSPAGSLELVAVTTMLTIMGINKTADVPARPTLKPPRTPPCQMLIQFPPDLALEPIP